MPWIEFLVEIFILMSCLFIEDKDSMNIRFFLRVYYQLYEILDCGTHSHLLRIALY